MDTGGFFSDEFIAAISRAGAQARIETLQAGVPVFYRDPATNLEIMEHPSGRKFEIRYINGASGPENYKVIRELAETAA
jgi:hypothetical protein